MYGKINKNGTLTVAQKMLIIGGSEVWFPTDEQYREHGYLPVTLTNLPETEPGYVAVCEWEEIDGTIVQRWHVEEAEPTADELLARLEEIL